MFFRGFNFATQMKRSPGSTIKPISVYAPAIEAGYNPDSILEDKPQVIMRQKNYDGDLFRLKCRCIKHWAQSLNLPAVLDTS